MELDLDGVDVGLQVLAEADELRERDIHALFDVAVADGECYAAVRGTVLQGSWE